MKTILTLLAALLATAVFGAQPDQRLLTVSFDANRVMVANVNPGATIMLFSVRREPQGYLDRIVREDRPLTDDDRNGSVTFELTGAVPMRSIWVAIDLASGDIGDATPPDAGVQKVLLSEQYLPHGDAPGQIRHLEQDRVHLELLLVRPGKGVWTLTPDDNSPEDDAKDRHGHIRALPSAFRPLLDTSASLHQFEPGDILVGADSGRLEFFIERIGR